MSSNGTPPPHPAALGLFKTKSPSHDPTLDRPKLPMPLRMNSTGPRRPKGKLCFSKCPPKSPIPSEPSSAACNHGPSPQDKLIAKVKERMGTLTFGTETHKLTGPVDVDVLGRLGSGMTGQVVTVQHKATGKIMAAKKMPWLEHPEERKRILMDLDVMAEHKSPHIVLYYGSVIWNNEVWVFMERMSTCLDRLLKSISGPVPEEIVCKVAVAVVKALHYLKTEHQVIHRDVKPSNILLDESGSVKLCDFGISGRLVDSQAFTQGAGCIAYMSPERIDQSIGKKGYDVRADVWSLGVSLVELATGSLPYDCSKFTTDFEFLAHIVGAPPPLPDRDSFSPLFFNFVSQCLTKDVDKRPNYMPLLEHPMIKEYEGRDDVDVGLWLKSVNKKTKA
ncbi:dual specificity mitogen-activated protein kinase kinase 7-like [Halichondria panicea]|uniref:dual specificity mitogen-activated protein kinase kinase 7-like n=1 Tax=Halichondria panicea TaxID=6063 RepID=UPI00312BAD53